MNDKGQRTVLQDTTIRNVDPLSLVGNNDNGSPQRHVTSKVDIACHRQMVQLENLGNLLEPLLELLDLRKHRYVRDKGHP